VPRGQLTCSLRYTLSLPSAAAIVKPLEIFLILTFSSKTLLFLTQIMSGNPHCIGTSVRSYRDMRWWLFHETQKRFCLHAIHKRPHSNRGGLALPPHDVTCFMSQGCSVLTPAWHSEDEIEVERGAPAGVFDVVASGAPEQIVGEGAQPGGDVRVLANA